ncbi:MAG: hypothetical protein AAFX87_17045 [Bacteroidota bacterium]
MFWIVMNDDPWPDKYIPVLVRSRIDDKELAGYKGYRTFDDEVDALVYAQRLKNKYSVNSIRLFPDRGPSRKICA